MRGDAPGSAFLSFRAGAHAGVGEEICFPCWCFDSFSSQHKKNESPSPESDSLYQSICPLPKPLKTLRFQGFILFYGKTSDTLPGSRLLRQAGRLNDEKKTAREGRSFSVFHPTVDLRLRLTHFQNSYVFVRAPICYYQDDRCEAPSQRNRRPLRMNPEKARR